MSVVVFNKPATGISDEEKGDLVSAYFVLSKFENLGTYDNPDMSDNSDEFEGPCYRTLNFRVIRGFEKLKNCPFPEKVVKIDICGPNMSFELSPKFTNLQSLRIVTNFFTCEGSFPTASKVSLKTNSMARPDTFLSFPNVSRLTLKTEIVDLRSLSVLKTTLKHLRIEAQKITNIEQIGSLDKLCTLKLKVESMDAFESASISRVTEKLGQLRSFTLKVERSSASFSTIIFFISKKLQTVRIEGIMLTVMIPRSNVPDKSDSSGRLELSSKGKDVSFEIMPHW